MSLRIRKILFYVCLVAFIVVGSYLVLMSRGVVLDLADLEFLPTGALYLRFTPTDATLLVNGKEQPVGSNILSPGTFVDNLAPGPYTVTITKPGFSSWTKTLTVSSSHVAAASHITLWPTHPRRTPLATGVADFWLTSAGAVTKDTATGLFWLGNRAIRGTRVVESDPDSSRLIIVDSGQFFLTDLSELDAAINISALFTSLRSRLTLPETTSSAARVERVRAVITHPFSGQKLIIGTDAGLYELDMRRISLERLAAIEQFTALAKSGGDAFIVNGSSTLTAVNLMLRTSIVYALPLSSGLDSLTASANGTYLAIILDHGDLLVLDRSAGTLSTVAKNVTAALIAEPTALMFLSADGHLNRYYLADTSGDELAQAGTLVTSVTRLPVPAENTLAAFPKFSGTVLVHASSTLLAAETDLRATVNTTALAANAVQFAVRDSLLYLLSTEGTLSSVDLAP